MLRPGEIARMRHTQETALPDLCDILDVTRVNNGGVSTDVEALARADVPCRLSSVSGGQRLAGGAIQPYSAWYIVMPAGTEVSTKQRIRLNGVTYAVKATDAGQSDQTAVRVEVQRV